MRAPSGTASPNIQQPRPPQRQRGRERVAALMESAAMLFVEKGFDATTMTEIAARAGASIGTLYLFFPTKEALAQGILTGRAEDLSARLDGLRASCKGVAPAAIADLLFSELGGFLAEHPVYAALLDLPGDPGWRHSLRARRRGEIAALFADADPALPVAQVERLATIVPQLMRIPLMSGDGEKQRKGVIEELRLMLRRHLETPSHD